MNDDSSGEESFAAPVAYQSFTAVPAIYGSPELATASVVADLPFPSPDVILRNAPYMLGSTRNLKPTLNGYSGFIPPSYYAHHVQLAGFPDAVSLGALHTLGVTHVFVHLDRLGLDSAEQVKRLQGLRQLEVDGSIALYRVEP